VYEKASQAVPSYGYGDATFSVVASGNEVYLLNAFSGRLWKLENGKWTNAAAAPKLNE
jgi:hypothetical protein